MVKRYIFLVFVLLFGCSEPESFRVEGDLKPLVGEPSALYAFVPGGSDFATFRWEQTKGPALDLFITDEPMLSIEAKEKGEYEIRLVASSHSGEEYIEVISLSPAVAAADAVGSNAAAA